MKMLTINLLDDRATSTTTTIPKFQLAQVNGSPQVRTAKFGVFVGIYHY